MKHVTHNILRPGCDNTSHIIPYRDEVPREVVQQQVECSYQEQETPMSPERNGNKTKKGKELHALKIDMIPRIPLEAMSPTQLKRTHITRQSTQTELLQTVDVSLTSVLVVIPTEDWCRTWETDRTIMVRKTCKRVKEVVEKCEDDAFTNFAIKAIYAMRNNNWQSW